MDALRLTKELLRKRYALAVMLSLYQLGSTNTSHLIEYIRGHPATVISTVPMLEAQGIVTRQLRPDRRHEILSRLSVRGIQLMETPFCKWDGLIQKWERYSTPSP